MLDPLSTWTSTLKALPSVDSQSTGAQNFAQALGDLMNKVQGGATGSPGIFAFAVPIMKAQLMTLTPTGGPEWATKLATGWQTACTASIITPGTVSNPAWTASGVDVLTLPTAAATITTISAAGAALSSSLSAVAQIFQASNPDPGEVANAPEKMAKAFRDATLLFQFTCIGLVLAPPAPPFPLPLPVSAM